MFDAKERCTSPSPDCTRCQLRRIRRRTTAQEARQPMHTRTQSCLHTVNMSCARTAQKKPLQRTNHIYQEIAATRTFNDWKWTHQVHVNEFWTHPGHVDEFYYTAKSTIVCA